MPNGHRTDDVPPGADRLHADHPSPYSPEGQVRQAGEIADGLTNLTGTRRAIAKIVVMVVLIVAVFLALAYAFALMNALG